MLKISMVMTTTALFAALLITGPSRLATASAETDATFVKVKTVAIHPTAGTTKVATFEPAKVDRKPNIRRNSGRMMAWNKFRTRSRA